MLSDAVPPGLPVSLTIPIYRDSSPIESKDTITVTFKGGLEVRKDLNGD